MFLTEFIGVSCMGLHKPLIVLILVYIAGWIGSVIDRGRHHIMRSLGMGNSWSAEFAGRKQEKPYAGNVINVLDESILHSFVILTKVGGYIILFSILAGIVQQMCPFAPEYKAGIVSALEITTGAVLLSSTIPGDIWAGASCCILRFRGLIQCCTNGQCDLRNGSLPPAKMLSPKYAKASLQEFYTGSAAPTYHSELKLRTSKAIVRSQCAYYVKEY